MYVQYNMMPTPAREVWLCPWTARHMHYANRGVTLVEVQTESLTRTLSQLASASDVPTAHRQQSLPSCLYVPSTHWCERARALATGREGNESESAFKKKQNSIYSGNKRLISNFKHRPLTSLIHLGLYVEV